MELHVRRAHQPYWRIADLRIVGDIDEIAGGSQFASSRQAITVHLRDNRFRQIPDAERAFDHVSSPLPGAARRVVRLAFGIVAAQVVASRETYPCTAQDTHP